MCNNLVFSKAGINNLYEAAKAAKVEGKEPLTAAKAAYDNEGVCGEDQELFLKSLENDPNLLNKITEDKNEIVINGSTDSKSEVQSTYNFVENPVKENHTNPTSASRRADSDIIYPDNPKLVKIIGSYAKELDSIDGSRQILIDYARGKALNEAKTDNEKESLPLYAENRTKDFLNVLDKAKEGKNLNKDDIQSVQTYLYFDTDHGKSLLSKNGDELSSIDGLYGSRTNSALKNVIGELSN